MRVPSFTNVGLRPLLGVVASVALLGGGCDMNKADAPAISGPSETGVSVQLVALPDILNADGVSTSIVRLFLRRSDGTPFSGLAVYFNEDGDGTLTPSSSSTYVGPVQEGIVMATDSNGQADVVYLAGFDHPRQVTVSVRPYNIDSVRYFERTAQILQR